jgi:hypothetical protein
MRSAFFKKLVAYQESWFKTNSKGQPGAGFSEHFGFRKVQILTLTKSRQRIDNIIAVSQELDPHSKGSRMFLFAPAEFFTLDKPELVLNKEAWLNAREEVTGLIR